MQIVKYLTAVEAGSISYLITVYMFIVQKMYVFYMMTVFVSVHLHVTQ